MHSYVSHPNTVFAREGIGGVFLIPTAVQPGEIPARIILSQRLRNQLIEVLAGHLELLIA